MTSPPGLARGIQHRFVDAAATPVTYHAESRTVDCVISMGSPVARFYGVEVLRIAPDAVIIDRLASGGIPLLDSHNQAGISNALARGTKAWVPSGALIRRLQFNETREGKIAQGMVARGERAGDSARPRSAQ